MAGTGTAGELQSGWGVWLGHLSLDMVSAASSSSESAGSCSATTQMMLLRLLTGTTWE